MVLIKIPTIEWLAVVCGVYMPNMDLLSQPRHSVKGGMRNGIEHGTEYETRNMEYIAHAQYIVESAKMPHVLSFI